LKVYLSFKIFYKDNNKYSKKQENRKKNLQVNFLIHVDLSVAGDIY